MRDDPEAVAVVPSTISHVEVQVAAAVVAHVPHTSGESLDTQPRKHSSQSASIKQVKHASEVSAINAAWKSFKQPFKRYISDPAAVKQSAIVNTISER